MRFWKRKPVTVPLVLEEPELWTDGDARVLNGFLASAVGQKLKNTLMYEAQARALAGVERTVFEQGIDAGKNRMLAGFLNLADVGRFGEDDPADKE